MTERYFKGWGNPGLNKTSQIHELDSVLPDDITAPLPIIAIFNQIDDMVKNLEYNLQDFEQAGVIDLGTVRLSQDIREHLKLSSFSRSAELKFNREDCLWTFVLTKGKRRVVFGMDFADKKITGELQSKRAVNLWQAKGICAGADIDLVSILKNLELRILIEDDE